MDTCIYSSGQMGKHARLTFFWRSYMPSYGIIWYQSFSSEKPTISVWDDRMIKIVVLKIAHYVNLLVPEWHINGTYVTPDIFHCISVRFRQYWAFLYFFTMGPRWRDICDISCHSSSRNIISDICSDIYGQYMALLYIYIYIVALVIPLRFY